MPYRIGCDRPRFTGALDRSCHDLGASPDIRGAIRHPEEAISLRSTSPDIDPVENGGQHVGTALERAVKAKAELRREDFSRVSRTHGGQTFAEIDATLQVADLVPELERLHIEHFPTKADRRERRCRKSP